MFFVWLRFPSVEFVCFHTLQIKSNAMFYSTSTPYSGRWSGLSRWAIAFSLGLTTAILPFASSAHADEDTAVPSGRSTGSRGCGTLASTDTSTSAPHANLPTSVDAAMDRVPALILLTPPQQPVQTVSTHPTFAWFVRDREALPLEFRIYKKTPTGYTLLKEIKGEAFRSVPGIMVLSRLNSLPSLTTGKRYRWQVELVCNADRPSGNLFAEADLEVVPVSPLLQRQLAAVDSALSTTLRLSQIYAQANLWYDALALLLTEPNPTDAQDLRRSLLNQIAINDTERQRLHNSPITPVLPLVSARE